MTQQIKKKISYMTFKLKLDLRTHYFPEIYNILFSSACVSVS